MWPYSGKIDLSEAKYQKKLDEDAKKICTITLQRLFKLRRLPHGLKISLFMFQNCIESNLKRIKGVVIFQDEVMVYGTTKGAIPETNACGQSRLNE